MSAAGAVRALFAVGFTLGALGHFQYVWRNGLTYHHDRPAWAVWFWYSLCAADAAVTSLLLTRPRPGLLAGNALLAVSLTVNWFVFDRYRGGFDRTLTGLTAFGAAFALFTPWLWRRSAQKP